VKLKNNNFKQLQAKWYKKLKDSGFEDAESSESHLKKWSNCFTREVQTDEQLLAKREYYRMAENFLTTYKFKTRLDQVIWDYHSNGMSARNIAATLNEVKIRSKSAVHLVIKRLREEMFKEYGIISNDN
jgi:hypothetical protein